MATGNVDPETLSKREQEAVQTLLYRLADDELVLAERYTEWAVHSPTLESDLALANIAQDELGHARLWYDLLEDFGGDERSLVFERDPAEFRHATLAELPFAEGDWADAVVRGYLYDVAEEIRLEALRDSAYSPLADRVGKVLGEEKYHREHARNWLERLASDDEGRERVQRALDRLFPHALALFEPTGGVSEAGEAGGTDEADEAIVELGLRAKSLAEMRDEWLDIVLPFLDSLDLDVPMARDDDPADLLPAQIGRDGDHTDAWPALHEEMTDTYRQLGRPEREPIMEEPE